MFTKLPIRLRQWIKPAFNQSVIGVTMTFKNLGVEGTSPPPLPHIGILTATVAPGIVPLKIEITLSKLFSDN